MASIKAMVTNQRPPSLTSEQAEILIRKHLGGHGQSTIKNLVEIQNHGLSFTQGIRTYILDIGTAKTSVTPCSCFVTISNPGFSSKTDNLNSETYHPNSLPAIYDVITRIRKNTDIPIPDSTLDISLELVPFPYLLSPASPISSSSIAPLSAARKSGMLSQQDTVFIDLQLGKFLGQIHSNVQNDWYGQFTDASEPPASSYSWQETFTLLLETLLCEAEAAGISLPYEDIRRYLSRAIGFFLFDDVEVPSLIWLTGSEDDIYVSLPSHPATATIKTAGGIAAILPNVAHALWGDPLLESFFRPPAPTVAFLEGYTASGGGQLTVFPRQKTKRIWYTLFLALIVLKERAETGTGLESAMPDDAWARKLILDSVEALANAPCY